MHRSHSRISIVGIIPALAVLCPWPALAQFAEFDVSVLYTLTTQEPGDGFGWAAEAIGDLNGDGASEIIIGALRNTTGGSLAGAAYVYSGRDGTLLNTLIGSPFDRLGHGVTGVGDVNADGVPDYAASGPGTFGAPPPQLGRLLVYSGATHTVLIDKPGPAHLSFFGHDINAAGDVDGDGHADVIVGAPFDTVTLPFSGAVHLISGLDGSTIRSHGALAQGSRFGTAVTRVDDENGDGTEDFAVGAVSGGAKFTGEAYVLSGTDGSLVRVLKAKQNTGMFFGSFFVHDAGDIDADGQRDIFAGDFGDTGGGPSAGLGYVFYGGRDDRRFFRPEEPTGGLGPGRGAGDVDGDGRDDVVIAAFTSSAAAPAGGKMFVYSGRNGKLIRTMTGTVANEQLGFDALAVGDVNDDGRIDFLITGTTTAHLILGNP